MVSHGVVLWFAGDEIARRNRGVSSASSLFLSFLSFPLALVSAPQDVAAAALSELLFAGYAEIHGLEKAPKLNGKVGKITGAPNDAGRIPVLLSGDTKAKLVKPANLKPRLSEAPVDLK